MEKTKTEITKPSFSLTAKIFHWSFVVLFSYGISKQIENINQLEDLALLKFEMSFAFLFILFLVIRFIYMTRTQRSSLPPSAPKAQKNFGKVSSLWHVYWDDFYSIFWPVNWVFVLAWLESWYNNRRYNCMA
jgi:cytochrome b561